MDNFRVPIGHLDTGVAGDVAVAAFRDFDADGCATTRPPRDTGEHGTVTAQLIHQTVPTAVLHAAAVIDQGHIYARILAGLEWMLGQPVRVVSLAIGLPTRTPVLEAMLERLRARDILVIVPSGNGGTGVTYTPGWSPHVLTIGATDENGLPAEYSASINDRDGRCLKPEILACGLFGELQGTSFASTRAAALIARHRERFPSHGIDQVMADLITCTKPIPAEVSHKARYGVLDSCRFATLRGSA